MPDDYDTLEVFDLDRRQAWENWLDQRSTSLTGIPLPAGRNGIGNIGTPARRYLPGQQRGPYKKRKGA